MQRYFETLADARGNVQAGLSVLVKIGGQNATIYSDNGTTVQANPMTSDSSGGISFYAANGTYDLSLVAASGAVTALRSQIILFDPLDCEDGTPTSSSTVVGETGGVVKRFTVSDIFPIVSVDLNGATGDGETDDAAIFQAALDALPAKGGTLLLGAKRYRLASGISWAKSGSLTIWGQGGMGYNANAASQLYFTGSGACITLGSASATSHNGHHLSKLYIEGNNSAGQCGVKTLRTNSNMFEMVRVNEMLGAGSIGFEFDGTGDATIINEMVQCGVRKVTTGVKKTKGTSLRISGGYYNAVGGTTGVDLISDDTFISLGANYDNWTTAIDTRNASGTMRGIRLIGNRFESNTTGVELGANVQYATCIGNYFNLGGTNVGFRVNASAAVIHLSDNIGHNITTGALVEDVKGRSTGNNAPRYAADLLATSGFSVLGTTGFTTAVAGTGAVTQAPAVLTLTTGATASSTALARTTGGEGWSAGKAYTVIDWSKRIVIALRVSRVSAGSANGKFRITLGKASGTGVGDLAAKGLGITFNRFQPVATVHDGSSLTTGNIDAANLAVATHNFIIVAHGDGTADFYLNGALAVTLSGAPTGDSTSGNTLVQVEAENGADAVANPIVINDWRVFVEQ